ncbi:MAG: branched-chain amino acid ABC transporter substrate-binding protein [Hyphomicrobiales bacterium]|nr:branched-chain amino acid ABC transporter substrate-binding protein [Hyphomicrobiales bacterium]
MKKVFAGAVACLLLCGTALAADPIKIGFVDPLSGGGATTGEGGLKNLQFAVDIINNAGGLLGRKVEIIPLDNKVNPQESLVQAQKAIDQGARYITQGQGSAVALALTDFISKYNERNPGKEVLYFNYAAVDPALTNAKCSFWHFRWDASADIKMAALTNFMKTRPNIKKIYLINQDYSFGQAVRTLARDMLKTKRPDIEIVGDEVHPLQKVTDFSPYIAKIKASGADSVITGDWGQDMALLMKAGAEAGLQVDWYTYYAGGGGGPTAIKQAGLEHRVFDIVEGNANSAVESAQKSEAEFRAKYGIGLWYPRGMNEIAMFAEAVKKAGTADDVKKVASALEGMKITVFDGGEGYMRKDDHQFIQDMYLRSFGPLDKGAKFDEENTGWGWKEIARINSADTIVPTTCKMERPN